MPRRLLRILIPLALVAAVLAFAIPSGYLDLARVLLTDLDTFSLDGYQRVLVVAPHMDDETLGAGGLIAQAVARGSEIRVVVATGGDAYLRAAMVYLQRPLPTRGDLVRLCEIRHQETLDAMEVLGVPPDQVIFLNYAERGLPALWEQHFPADDPWRSPYSGGSQSPYAPTYNPQAVFAGQYLLDDLTALLSAYRPDLVVYPHANDEHRDHWALNGFVRLALVRAQIADPAYQPTMLMYLVHNTGYPLLSGLHTEAELVPPARLAAVTHGWRSLALSPEEVERKVAAIACYPSQASTLEGFLLSFARANELFQQDDPPAPLETLAEGFVAEPDGWRDARGEPLAAAALDPLRDTYVRERLAGADLVALHVALDGDGRLLLTASTRARGVPGLRYTLHAAGIDAQGAVHHVTRSGAPRRAGSAEAAFGTAFALADLGDPLAVVVYAEVRLSHLETLDRTAHAVRYVGPLRGPAPEILPLEGVEAVDASA